MNSVALEVGVSDWNPSNATDILWTLGPVSSVLKGSVSSLKCGAWTVTDNASSCSKLLDSSGPSRGSAGARCRGCKHE